jgi:capsule polysaccharide export protein KpsE/RkpR
MKLMDRVAAGLDQLGKKAAQAIDESKLRMAVAGVRRRKDHAARDLGYLAYRQSKGEILAEGDTELQIRRIAAAEEEIAKLEADLAKVRERNAPPAGDAPPPAADAGTPTT